MNVRLVLGAQHAYAAITTNKTSLDVQLEAGRSASQSLREYAGELRQKAALLICRASLMEEAAITLDNPNT